MKKTKLNNLGFTHFILPLLIVVVVAVIGVYFLVRSHAEQMNASRLTIAYGTITADSCAKTTLPLSPSGCTITVSGTNTSNDATGYASNGTSYTIQIVPSTVDTKFPDGRFLGFGQLTTDYTGYPVSVNAYLSTAQLSQPGSPVIYKIDTSDSYYVQVLAAVYTGTVTANNCATHLSYIYQTGCSLNFNGSTTVEVIPSPREMSINLPVGQYLNFGTTMTKAPNTGLTVPSLLLSPGLVGRTIEFFGQRPDPNWYTINGTTYTIVGHSQYYIKLL